MKDKWATFPLHCFSATVQRMVHGWRSFAQYFSTIFGVSIGDAIHRLLLIMKISFYIIFIKIQFTSNFIENVHTLIEINFIS